MTNTSPQALHDMADRLREEIKGFVGYSATHHGIGSGLIDAASKAVEVLESFASRIDATLTEEVVKRACKVLVAECGTLEGVGGCVETMPIPDDDAMQKALESIWPVSSARATLKAIDAALAREALREHDSSASAQRDECVHQHVTWRTKPEGGFIGECQNCRRILNGAAAPSAPVADEVKP
jgi:hypothetical protein